MFTKNMFKRATFHFLGIALIALGIALIVSQNKGLFPWDAASLSLVSLFGKIGLSIQIGTASVIMNITLGILCIIFTRKIQYLYSFINVIILGVSLNIFISLIKVDTSTVGGFTFMNVLMLFLGLLAIAVGTNFTILSKLIPSPVESMLIIIHKNWFPKSIGLSKIALETIFIMLALTLGFINGNAMEHLSWFTIIAITVLSPLIQLIYKPIKLLYGGIKDEVK